MALAAAVPLLKHAAADYAGNGVTSHVLEGMAVSISLARADYTAANTTTFMLAWASIWRSRSPAVRTSFEAPAASIQRRSLGHARRRGILVPVDTVEVGETVIVGTGSIIPIDGTVLGGEATVNEAAMTGESVSVVKGRGAVVLSGTLVEEGRLSIYAEQVGGRTAAARIAEYVQQSLSRRARRNWKRPGWPTASVPPCPTWPEPRI